MFNSMFKFAVMFNVMYFGAFNAIASQKAIIILRLVSEVLGMFRYIPVMLFCKVVLDLAVREPLQIAMFNGLINK